MSGSKKIFDSMMSKASFGLRTLVEDLIAEHGAPTQREKQWAKRVLAPQV